MARLRTGEVAKSLRRTARKSREHLSWANKMIQCQDTALNDGKSKKDIPFSSPMQLLKDAEASWSQVGQPLTKELNIAVDNVSWLRCYLLGRLDIERLEDNKELYLLFTWMYGK